MSKKLDQELAEAAGINSDGSESNADKGRSSTPAVAKAIAPLRNQNKVSSTKNMGLLVTLLVMVGGIVMLFLFGFKDAAIYSLPVDQLSASPDKMLNRKVRVEGELVPGTLVRRDKPCEYRFKVHGEQSQLAVRYAQCVIPDTFRDVPEGGVQVTLEGSLKSPGDFEATLVMAKCTSKYDPSTHKMKEGEGAPGSMPIN